jgi:hypothetical protein
MDCPDRGGSVGGTGSLGNKGMPSIFIVSYLRGSVLLRAIRSIELRCFQSQATRWFRMIQLQASRLLNPVLDF